ncbi:Predicted arabinose efflux permease, MFS family [Trichlorobacter thiogenes]|uniref:Predicted arabinose efflux permease, MFS family n=1 Tax=Trichlorobacter thiogenes TaxID=115783 RepID=A0A1T4NI88_9BACT|nr:MFS transporter [Trichlorobacter thiogenes]SJZ79041.1 Predicted arabinose efflux permease, MFS family [Trichlorobacter thiogenes]
MSNSLVTRPFLLLCIQFLAVSTIVANFFPLQEYLTSLGMPAASAGFILGADALAALIVQPFITPLITARTARRWLLAGALILATALIMEGTCNSEFAFTLARLLQGAGFICVVAAIMPLFVLCIPREMSGRAFGWISLVRLIPYAVVPLLFDLFKIAPSALGGVIRWSALLALLAGALLWLLPRFPQEQEPATGASFAGIKNSLSDRNLLLLFAATVLLYAGYAATFFYLKGFGRAAGLGNSGLFFTVATVMMMLVRLFGGSLFDRFDKRLMNMVFLALSAIGTGLILSATNATILLGLAVVCGIGWGVVMPLLNALIFDLSRPEARGLNQNLGLLMLQCGFFLGPLAGGWLLPQGGYPLLFGAAACALLLAAGLVMLIRNRDV